MKYIFLVITLLAITLNALEFNFQDFRETQKRLVLKEFKRLFKERKNIQHNMRQVLKHARSKNLHKNSISFFQAKDTAYKESYLVELNNLYTNDEPICESECKNEISESSTDSINGDLDYENAISDTVVSEIIDSNIRGSVKNPWAKR